MRKALLLPLLLLAACTGGGDTGPTRSEARGVEAFHSIDLQGAGRLDVLVGPRQSVTVEGADGALRRLATSVRNGVLVIETQEGRFWEGGPGEVALRITLPKLNSLALNGAGRISVNGIAGGETTLVLSGAGQIEAAGTLRLMTLRVNGAGSADLSRLLAEEAEVTLNGAGTVQVHATQRLDATVNGVGTITYDGQPQQLNTTLNGIGRITARGAG